MLRLFAAARVTAAGNMLILEAAHGMRFFNACFPPLDARTGKCIKISFDGFFSRGV
jgi:hypothetical protein